MADQTTPWESMLVRAPEAVRAPAWDGVQRALDVVLVFLALPVLLPLISVLAGLKRLIDGSPVFFNHVRLGLNGEPFVLYKFRTTPIEFQARPDDWSDESFPPRTRFGGWLRRFDLDELPQLWNVLKGEMSLVGPRPEMPIHAKTFSCRIPEFTERLAVRPGLTGLAQVRGWRGNTSIRLRLISDLEYIGNRGPARYMEILARTISMEWRRLSEPSRDQCL